MTIKIATGFTPFHLVHGIEAVLPIECEIPTLHSIIDLLLDTTPLAQRLLFLKRLDEDRCASLQHNEAIKWRSKAAYDQRVQPRTFHEGYLFLAYHTAKSKLSPKKFKPC